MAARRCAARAGGRQTSAIRRSDIPGASLQPSECGCPLLSRMRTVVARMKSGKPCPPPWKPSRCRKDAIPTDGSSVAGRVPRISSGLRLAAIDNPPVRDFPKRLRGLIPEGRFPRSLGQVGYGRQRDARSKLCPKHIPRNHLNTVSQEQRRILYRQSLMADITRSIWSISHFQSGSSQTTS